MTCKYQRKRFYSTGRVKNIAASSSHAQQTRGSRVAWKARIWVGPKEIKMPEKRRKPLLIKNNSTGELNVGICWGVIPQVGALCPCGGGSDALHGEGVCISRSLRKTKPVIRSIRKK